MKEVHRFHLIYLLGVLILILFFYPFFETSILGVYGMHFLLTLFVGLSVFMLSKNQFDFIGSLFLGILWLVFSWLSIFWSLALLPSYAFGAAFIMFLVVNVVSRILHERKIDANILCGAISAYLLLGLLWSILYAVIEYAAPGSFSHIHSHWFDFLYYSFTVLTTLGFGDIVPLSTLAKSFSMLEAITGTLFVAVLIARLVSAYHLIKK